MEATFSRLLELPPKTLRGEAKARWWLERGVCPQIGTDGIFRFPRSDGRGAHHMVYARMDDGTVQLTCDCPGFEFKGTCPGIDAMYICEVD